MDIVLYKTVKKMGVSKKYIFDVLTISLKKLKQKNGSISLSVIGEYKMRRLNKNHRNKDYVTDVLSFPADSNSFFGKHLNNLEREYGDIIICPKQIERQAKEYNITYKEEFTRMLVHGVLHLLGYDHIKKKDAAIMFPKQEKIVKYILQKKKIKKEK